MKLEGYGEDRLVRELIARVARADKSLIVGPGDDCAVVEVPGSKYDLLLKTDAVVEGVHFEANADPRLVGRKALCRAISDVAAMGGKPTHALITLGVSGDRSVEWVHQLYVGIARAALTYGVTIAGGETTRSPQAAFISVALTGRVKQGRAVLRSGGESGDLLLVTGRLGGSIAGRHLRFQPRLAEARWLAKNGGVHAMMDLSDGLAADLPRLARASKLNFELDHKKVPRRAGMSLERALRDGEDYELLLAISPVHWIRLASEWKEQFPRLPLTCIGRLLPGKCPEEVASTGYQHF